MSVTLSPIAIGLSKRDLTSSFFTPIKKIRPSGQRVNKKKNYPQRLVDYFLIDLFCRVYKTKAIAEIATDQRLL